MPDQGRPQLRRRGLEANGQGVLEQRNGAIHKLECPGRSLREFLFENSRSSKHVGTEFILETRKLQLHAASFGHFTKSGSNQTNLPPFIGNWIEIHYPAAQVCAGGRLSTQFKIRLRNGRGPNAPEGRLQLIKRSARKYLVQLPANLFF